MRVLVIDPDEGDRRRLVLGLRAGGLRAEAVATGAAGLARLEEERFDFAIVELLLDDVRALRLLRCAADRFPSLQLVLTSAYHLGARQLRQTGVDLAGFLPKPWSRDELVGFLRRKSTPPPPPPPRPLRPASVTLTSPGARAILRRA
ncbi:MAG: response regulator [Myxococcota bacterium]